MDELLSISVLASALKNRLNLVDEEAKDKAEMLMDIFCFEDRILDNHLSSATRKFFYILQQEKIVISEQECFELPYGSERMWRMFFWRLNISNIIVFAMKNKIQSPKKMCMNIYVLLDESAWRSRAFDKELRGRGNVPPQRY